MTTPITNSNIKTAVDLWISDQTTAEATYGHISDWDTSNVTNLTNVLNEKIIKFDISKWDISKAIKFDKLALSNFILPTKETYHNDD